MKVEIWSDIRCPFCYIGKRKFEIALDQFENKEDIEVIWRSFELDPLLRPAKNTDIYSYLAEVKGIHREKSVQLHDHVTQLAAEVGLQYNFDKTIVANSFNAHRLIQLAKTYGLDDEAEEALFKGYFTDGIDISDDDSLKRIGTAIGLNQHEIEEMLAGDRFAEAVQTDEAMAQQLGIRGVPFFRINESISVSGAQPPAVFLSSLNEALAKQNDNRRENSDNFCSSDGEC